MSLGCPCLICPQPRLWGIGEEKSSKTQAFHSPGSQLVLTPSFLATEKLHTQRNSLRPPRLPSANPWQQQRTQLSPKGCSTAREIRGRENAARTLRKTEVPCLLGKHRKDSQQALGLQVEEKDQEEEADTPLGADSVSHTHTSAQSSG